MPSAQTNGASPLERLQRAVQRFVEETELCNPASPGAAMKIGAELRLISAAIAAAEVSLSASHIHEAIDPARQIVALSPIGQQMQTWPRGYPGDFETVEWIVRQDNRAVPGTLGALIEQQGLESAACQQHRNKIAFQARLIAQTVEQPNQNILLVAAGSALDLQSVAYLKSVRDCGFALNDIDQAALDAATQSLGGTIPNLTLIPGNALQVSDQVVAAGPYDLILMGGLFDYLADRPAELLLRVAFSKWLMPGGLLYFSNIACGNPFRQWMEYLVNWNLIERSQDDLTRLVETASRNQARTDFQRDGTGLAYLVLVHKPRH